MLLLGIGLAETTLNMIKILIILIALNQKSLILLSPFSIDLIHTSYLALRRLELFQPRVYLLFDLRHLLLLLLHLLEHMGFVDLTAELVGQLDYLLIKSYHVLRVELNLTHLV